MNLWIAGATCPLGVHNAACPRRYIKNTSPFPGFPHQSLRQKVKPAVRIISENQNSTRQVVSMELSMSARILRVIKPPLYSVAVVPSLVGSSAWFHTTGSLNMVASTTFLLSSLLIIAWLNLTNDAFDSGTGTDLTKEDSAVALVGGRVHSVFYVAWGCLALAFSLILYRLYNPTLILTTMIAVFIGYIYQGPPFRLGYLGLGEPLCLLAFGPVAHAAVVSAQLVGRIDTSSRGFMGEAMRGLSDVYFGGSSMGSTLPVWFVASILVGISTSAILSCANFHQFSSDGEHGKRTLCVRIGTLCAAKLLILGVSLQYTLAILLICLRLLPMTTLLIIFSIPTAIDMCRFVFEHHANPPVVKRAKFFATKWHVTFGIALALGLLDWPFFISLFPSSS